MNERHRSRSLAVAIFTVFVLMLPACTSTGSDPTNESRSTSPSSSSDDSVTIRVAAADGGTVSVGGATLSIPAGSLDRDTDVSLSVMTADPPRAISSGPTNAETSTSGGSPSAVASSSTGARDAVLAPAFFKAAGPMVSGDLGGAQLSNAATLLLPLFAPVAGGTVAGYLDEEAGKWVAVPATLNTAAKTIATRVPHLSRYQPWTWDFGAVRAGLETNFAALVGAGVALRTDPPKCSAAPPNVSVAVTGGRSGDPSLDGCIEDAGSGQARLRLVNNRPYGMVITPPDGATEDAVSRGGLLAALYQAKELSDIGGDYLPAGGEADYLLPADGPTVSATGAWSWKTYTLDVAISLLLTLAGKGAKPIGPAATVDASATMVPPVELVKVGKCLGDKLFSGPPTSTAGAIRTSIGCLGLLEKVWLAPLALLQGLLIDVAGAYDAGQDTGLGSPGVVTVTRPPVPPAAPVIDQAGAVLGPYIRAWGRTGSLLRILPDQSGCMRAGNSAVNRVTYQLTISVDGDGSVLGTVTGTPQIAGIEEATFDAGHVFRFRLENGGTKLVSTNPYSDHLPDLMWEGESVDGNDCGFDHTSTSSTTATAASTAKVDGPSAAEPPAKDQESQSATLPTASASVVALDEVCDAMPIDAHSMVVAGQQYNSGQLPQPQVQQLLGAMRQRWTPAAEVNNVASNEEGAESHLAGVMVSLLQQTSFAATNHEEPVFVSSDWTGGDLGSEYNRVCGKSLTG